jgi:hypothetical protein
MPTIGKRRPTPRAFSGGGGRSVFARRFFPVFLTSVNGTVLPTAHSIKGELRKYSNTHQFTVELIIPVLLVFKFIIAMQSVVQM